MFKNPHFHFVLVRTDGEALAAELFADSRSLPGHITASHVRIAQRHAGLMVDVPAKNSELDERLGWLPVQSK